MNWSDCPSTANDDMLNRDTGATPASMAAEDPLADVLSAIYDLRQACIDCAIDECMNSGPSPSGHTRDPDYSSADGAEAVLLKAIDDLIASRPASLPVDDEIKLLRWLQQEDKDTGLLVVHNPDKPWRVL